MQVMFYVFYVFTIAVHTYTQGTGSVWGLGSGVQPMANAFPSPLSDSLGFEVEQHTGKKTKYRVSM